MASPKTASKCLYCGNNPTSHIASWVDSTVSIAVGPFFERVFRVPGGKYLLRFAERVLDEGWRLLLLTQVVVFKEGEAHVPSSRGKVLYEEAVARGWKMETAVVLGRPLDMYRVVLPNARELVFRGLPRLKESDASVSDQIDDKAVLKERLESAGVPVPKGRCVRSWDDAVQCFHEIEKPVITKPRLGSRGRHTTTRMRTLTDLEKGFAIARQLGAYVILEEHLDGSVYRATMIDGNLAGALAGDPPRITGDGEHTIEELIELKNEKRHERVSPYRVSPLTPAFLERSGYSLTSILPEGLTIDLTEKIGLSYGGNAREVTPEVHPKLRDELERAARVVGDPIIGFDFISTDIGADPSTVRWGIIECNAVPFINLHHDPLEGEPVNVAKIFWDYIERELKVS